MRICYHIAPETPRLWRRDHDSATCTKRPSSNAQIAMADPTKAETEQVFKVLRAQKANLVRPPISCYVQYLGMFES